MAARSVGNSSAAMLRTRAMIPLPAPLRREQLLDLGMADRRADRNEPAGCLDLARDLAGYRQRHQGDLGRGGDARDAQRLQFGDARVTGADVDVDWCAERLREPADRRRIAQA